MNTAVKYSPERMAVLQRAVDFHGHLGPWLVIGLISGEEAVRKLGCKRHFGLSVKARGVGERPKSCLVDGLQMSTGATYGKGNIEKISGHEVKIEVSGDKSGKSICFVVKQGLLERLERARTHHDAEALAQEIFAMSPEEIFDITTSTND